MPPFDIVTLNTSLSNITVATASTPVSPAILVKVTVGSVVYPLPPEINLTAVITPLLTEAIA